MEKSSNKAKSLTKEKSPQVFYRAGEVLFTLEQCKEYAKFLDKNPTEFLKNSVSNQWFCTDFQSELPIEKLVYTDSIKNFTDNADFVESTELLQNLELEKVYYRLDTKDLFQTSVKDQKRFGTVKHFRSIHENRKGLTFPIEFLDSSLNSKAWRVHPSFGHWLTKNSR